MENSQTHRPDYENLIIIKNNIPATTSKIISDKFDKPHKSVIRAIKKIRCSEDFRLHNFVLSFYFNEQSRKHPMYLITRDGFTFLAMGFTGNKAAIWKERYIHAFNLMEEAIRRQANISWQEMRLQGKVARLECTDALKLFVEYAKGQGSKNADKYYMALTKATYQALFLIDHKAEKNFRNMLSKKQLSFLQTAEFITQAALQEGMKNGLYYKDIYKLARDRVKNFSESIVCKSSVPMIPETIQINNFYPHNRRELTRGNPHGH